MNKQNQKGSIEIILVVIVVVAIMGGIGWLAWNAINKKDAEAQQSSHSSSKSSEVKPVEKDLEVGRAAASFPAQLTWEYPRGWSQKITGDGPKEGEADPTSQTVTITSPSKKYDVWFLVAVNGGFGGTCGKEAGTLHSITKDSNAQLPDATFAETISFYKETGEYNYRFGLYQNAQLQQASLGTSMCNIGLMNSVQLSDRMGMELMTPMIRLKSIDPESTEDRKPIKDVSLITSETKSDEYKEAVKILQSLKIN